MASYGSKHTSKQLWIRRFGSTFTHNSKTTGCMRTFYVSNYCPTICKMYIFCVRGGLKILIASNAFKHPSQSLSDRPILRVQCSYRRTTWKLQVVLECSPYLTTAILSETFFVCFRVALEIQLESYGPRHASVVF